MYVAGRDIPDSANPLGMIIFMVAEYGAGTPVYSNMPADQRQQLTERPFVAALCQRLLSHPNGAALAIIAHVDMSFQMTFDQFKPGTRKTEDREWKSEGNATFLNTVSRLVRGHTVGSAMEFFNVRYMQAAADLVDRLLTTPDFTKSNRDRDLLEAIDVRNYIVLGDPAVRLPVDGPVPAQRPTVHVEPSLVDEIDAKLQPAPAAVAADEPVSPAAQAPLTGPAPRGMQSDAEPTPAAPDAARPAPAPGAPGVPAAAAAPAGMAPPGPTPAPTPTPTQAPGTPGANVNVNVTIGPLATFNGITLEGDYAYPPMSIEEFASLATKRPGESQTNVDVTYKSAGTSYFESSSGSGDQP
jgi:hypothetical protein